MQQITISITPLGLNSSSQCKQKDIYKSEMVTKIIKSCVNTAGMKSTITQAEKQKPRNYNTSQHQTSVQKTITVPSKWKSILVSDEPNASKSKNIRVSELAGNAAVASQAIIMGAVATMSTLLHLDILILVNIS